MRNAALFTIILLLALPATAVASSQRVPGMNLRWDDIFPKGLVLDFPKTLKGSNQRAKEYNLPFEKLNRLRLKADGTKLSDLDYVSNVAGALLSISTDDILYETYNAKYKVDYDERMRFFLGPAWVEYQKYIDAQKKRLTAKLPKYAMRSDDGLRTIAEFSPDTRRLNFANGKGSFDAVVRFGDGSWGKYAFKDDSFRLRLEFITDKASPDIIISKWTLTPVNPVFKVAPGLPQ